MTRLGLAWACLVAASLLRAGPAAAAASRKEGGALYPDRLVARAVANAGEQAWAREIRDRVVERARPWRQSSDEELWAMVFGPGITRSWMVWSDGQCPACRRDVKMYSWLIDVWRQPWKVRCPHCRALFPTNDFAAYYRSGLDDRALFDPGRADRALLVNAEHEGAGDPLRGFGVDDGEGYVAGEQRWRFIGYYLIAGQWRQLVIGGIRALSEAYLVTGDKAYARKAGILLDRVADLYPEFDFRDQGLVYERAGHQGYVTVWHDACEEARELAQAYDRVFGAMRDDPGLTAFLAAKARQFRTARAKADFAAIQANIEERILRHTLEHRERIESNFPRTPIALLTIRAVLGWPDNRAEILAGLREIAEGSAVLDGLTGEKGLSGYTTIFPASFAELLGRFDRLDPRLLDDLFGDVRQLNETYRFHIDTWCLDQYYPREGDCGSFGARVPTYAGVSFARPAANAEPSMFLFLWRVYELTGDPAFVQVLYNANGGVLDGLPHDICAEDPAGFQTRVRAVIAEAGAELLLGDVNKEQWGISILRSGRGDARRAVWIDHDAGGRHSHRDGLNIGLFAKGRDLLPDFGYPPVGYGGWSAPKAVWYTKSAAHNTVVVDSQDHQVARGRTELWGSGEALHIARVAGPELIRGERFARTVALVDLSAEDCYLVDIADVRGGGREHAKFVSSGLGAMTWGGLAPAPAATPWEVGEELRMDRRDPAPALGWWLDWELAAPAGEAGPGPSVHLRLTDLTLGAEAWLGHCWVDAGLYGGRPEWLPRAMTRRMADSGVLESRFVAVLEPYIGAPLIAAIRREELVAEDGGGGGEGAGVALAIGLRDGREQLVAVASPAVAAGTTLRCEALDLTVRGEAAVLWLVPGGAERIALCGGSLVRRGMVELELGRASDYVELTVAEGAPRVVRGERELIARMRVGVDAGRESP